MPLVSGRGAEFREESAPYHVSLSNICSCRTRGSVGTSCVRFGLSRTQRHLITCDLVDASGKSAKDPRSPPPNPRGMETVEPAWVRRGGGGGGGRVRHTRSSLVCTGPRNLRQYSPWAGRCAAGLGYVCCLLRAALMRYGEGEGVGGGGRGCHQKVEDGPSPHCQLIASDTRVRTLAEGGGGGGASFSIATSGQTVPLDARSARLEDKG